MQNSVIIEQISFLAILILTGFIASRIGIIKEKERDALVKIIFNITLPVLLVTNFSKLDLTPAILRNSLVVIIITLVIILLMLLGGYMFSLFLRLRHEKRSVFIAHNGFGNILYFGFPVVSALYGEIGLFYASLYAFVSIMLLWTVGIYVITRNGGMSFADSARKMINPNSVAILLGFVMFLLEIKIPPFLLKPFSSLGGTTIYLSMLYIGALLGLMNMKGLFGNRLVYLTTFNKNILYPLLLILFFYLTGDYVMPGLDPLITGVVIIEASMPCMANVVIVARIYKVDDHLATSNVFMSTLLSLITLPLVWWLINMFIQN